MNDAGIEVSLFITPEPKQIEAAARTGSQFVELHTGAFAEGFVEKNKADENRDPNESGRKLTSPERRELANFLQLQLLIEGAKQAHSLGLRVNAGHGLNFDTSETLAAVPWFSEFNTGHFLIGEAIFVGLPQTIRRVREAMAAGRARAE